MVLKNKASTIPILCRITPGETLGRVAVPLLLLALHFHGLGTITIAGHISISLADLVTLALAYIWSIHALTARLQVPHLLLVSFALASLLAVWIGIEAFRSPQPLRGLTMFLMMLRNVIIFGLVGTVIRSTKSMEHLNKLIFLMGVIIAGLSVVLFLHATQPYQTILNDPSKWKPRIIYVLDEGGILRLQGFAGDPNFYSLWMSLSLFCGLNEKRIHRLIRWVGTLVIGASLLLALSRGFFVAVLGSTLLVVLALRRARVWWGYTKPLIVMGSLLGTLVLVSLPFTKTTIVQWTVTRFQTIGSSMSSMIRFEAWRTLWNSFDSPWIGRGLRGAEDALGGMYSHNSYLDLVIETGLIGFILWVLFVGLVLVKGLKGIRSPDLLPYVHCWILTLFMLSAFSLTYNPFLWLVPAIIVGRDYANTS